MGRGVKIKFQLKYGLRYDAVDIIGHLTIVLKYLLKQPFLNPFFSRDGNNIHKYGCPNGQIMVFHMAKYIHKYGFQYDYEI